MRGEGKLGIYNIMNKTPQIASEAFIHPEATVIGDVKIGKYCFVAPEAVIRGDLGKIQLGHRSNVQDYTIIQSSADYNLTIGTSVNIGHGSIICASKVEDNASVGMKAILSYRSEICKGSMIGDGCHVLPGQKIPPDSLAIGRPAKIIRKIDSHDPARELINRFVDWYAKAATLYHQEHKNDLL